MDFLEKDLEQIICDSYGDELENRGLYMDGKIYRQLNIGVYGIADIVSVSRVIGEKALKITVYELKRNKIDSGAFMQAVCYLKGITRYIEFRKPDIKLYTRIILIGRSLDQNNSFCFLPDIIGHGIENKLSLKIYTYSYQVDGVWFNNESGYYFRDEDFKH